MKKLFAVLMVLGLCGTASAVIVSLEGEGTTIGVAKGTSVTINVLAAVDNGNPGLLGLDAIITVSGTPTTDIISDALKVADAAGYGWSMGLPPFGLGTSSVEIGGANFMVAVIGTVGYVVVDYQGGTQLVTIAGGTNLGGSFENDGMTVPSFSLGTVTIVPEPITIALLGLGGLFLLRRRK